VDVRADDGRPSEVPSRMSALLLPIYILIFIGLIYLVGVRPQQKRRRQLAEILQNLRPGDEVVTVSGIYGTVTEVEDGETMLLEVAEDTDIRVAKSSIARKVAGPESGADLPAATDADSG
jgi:preprotein translocase subunit YajC